MRNQPTSLLARHARPICLSLVAAGMLCGCGGGDDLPTPVLQSAAPPAGAASPSQPVAPPAMPVAANPNAPVQPVAVPAATPLPTLSSAPIRLASRPVGLQGVWPAGDTAVGGQGAPVAGIECASSEAYHVHAHLAIIRDGRMLAIPAQIGIPNACTYALHTHDESGEIHVEATARTRFTLGQFFAVWGQPLSATNIAGLTGQDIAVFIQDGTALSRYTGDIGDIELSSHRSITIQIGSAFTEIPTYEWDTSN